MLWFASKLLAGIFSLSPSTSSKKAITERARHNTLSTRSSLSTLVDDGASLSSDKTGACYLKLSALSGHRSGCCIIGHVGALKRMRSDATLSSLVGSSENVANVDEGHSSSQRKRRRLFFRGSYVQKPFSQHTHIYAPPSLSREVAQINAPSCRSESAVPHLTTSRRARRAMTLSTPPVGPDLGPFLSDIPPAPSSIQAFAVPLPGVPHHDPPVGCDGLCPTRSVPSEPAPSSESVDASSPELSSRPAAPEGEVTRIEITFEQLYQGLLHSHSHDTLIQKAARRISTSSLWLGAYNAYKEAARRCRFSSGAGFRKNRFMDLMNLIVEEAPRCGLDVPYTHQLRYSRYHYDGSRWSPENSEDRSSESESRDCETSDEPSQSALPSSSCKHLTSSCDNQMAPCLPAKRDHPNPTHAIPNPPRTNPSKVRCPSMSCILISSSL
jgi:hypothetical protein